MTDSPLLDADGPVTVEILSSGNRIPDTVEIHAVRTRSELNRVAEAVIILGDGNPATQEFPVTDGDEFKPGSEIEIKAGYANQPQSIFKGIVTSVRLRIDGTSGSRLEVTCRHHAAVLLQGRRRTVFEAGKSDSELISEVANAAGISVDVESTGVTLPAFVRFDVSDWDFIVNRADVNGLVVACTESGLTIGAPDYGSRPNIEVTYGEDLIAIDMEVSVLGQFAEFHTSAWDPAKQELEIIEAKSASDNTYGDLKTETLAKVLHPESASFASSAFHDNSALSAYAKARATRADLAKIQGWVAFQGNASLMTNSVLALSALGNRFSGNGLIGGVLHRIESGNWKTEVQFGLPADWIADKSGISAPAASAVTGGARGLVIGKVTKLDKDPDRLSRIQVVIPEFDQGVTPVWARLGSSYATNGSGCMFLPEVDDEVIVGFLNDNPSAAVVLGSLHNPKATPPQGFVDYDKANNTKAIVSREQIKVTFDEEKKALTLETPAGNKMEIDDDGGVVKLSDQNGNTATLHGDGITLDSASDVVIKAAGNIAITAAGNLKMSGVDVSADGSAGFTANGRRIG